MKKILSLCIFIVVVATAIVWRAAAKPSRFGTFNAALRAEVARLVAEPKAFLGKTIDIEGTIPEQCKTMGCFFYFQSGNETRRVDLQDVAMKAPCWRCRSMPLIYPATGLPSTVRQTGRCAKLPCGSRLRAMPSPGTYGTSAKAINRSSTADWTATPSL
jgi:hypothetical protein